MVNWPWCFYMALSQAEVASLYLLSKRGAWLQVAMIVIPISFLS